MGLSFRAQTPGMEKLHFYFFPPETSNSKWSLRNIFLFCPPLPPRGHLPQPSMGFCRPNESHTWLKSSGNGRSPVHTCQEGKYGKNWSSVLTTKVTKVPAHFFFPFFPLSEHPRQLDLSYCSSSIWNLEIYLSLSFCSLIIHLHQYPALVEASRPFHLLFHLG